MIMEDKWRENLNEDHKKSWIDVTPRPEPGNVTWVAIYERGSHKILY